MQLHSRGQGCSHISKSTTKCRVNVVAAFSRQRGHSRRVTKFCCSMEEEEHRSKVKHLTRLFYGSTSTHQPGLKSEQARRGPRVLKGSHIPQLPLWRVEWVVLPGMQEILHVLAPHYVHMFEKVFSAGRPWVFGHLYLPGGSKSLGAPSHALVSGTQAPLVGVLMQVTRAVRLRDGKFLLLATALGRFKVVRCHSELPYSEADVELMEDCETLEGLSTAATAAVLQAASEDVGMSQLMAASNAAALEAAAASHWSWLRGYEARVAAGQDWPGPGPREGENDAETYQLVQELAAQGVAEVLPLPDGVVIGRCNLQQVSTDAKAAAQQALQEAAKRLTSSSSSSGSIGRGPDSSGPGSGPGDSTADESPAAEAFGNLQQGQSSSSSAATNSSNGTASRSSSDNASISSSSNPLSSSEGLEAIASLNTVGERGVAFQDPEAHELTGTTSCSSNEEVLMLEAAVWQQLDILAALAARVKGRRHSLPFGLLQLRPPPPQVSVAAATILANQAAAAAAAARGSAGAGSDASSGTSSTSSTGVLLQDTGVLSAQPPAAEVVSDTDDDEDSSSQSSSSLLASGGESSSTGPTPRLAGSSTPANPSSSTSSSAGSSTPVSPSSSSSSSSSAGSSLSSRSAVAGAASADPARYAFAASEGMDVHADPLWPPLRRAAKLSYSAALVTGELDLDKGQQACDMRQALLETPSIASRLRYVLAVLQKHSKVLAALAAVKDVQE